MSQNGRGQPILIAGGGIGGLAAGYALASKGFPVRILEQAPEFREIGAGIQLGPNAFHAFDYLGVGEAARGMAVYIDQLRLMDALTAEEITHDERRGCRATIRADAIRNLTVVLRSMTHGEVQLIP